jgi:hypothetical protein
MDESSSKDSGANQDELIQKKLKEIETEVSTEKCNFFVWKKKINWGKN